MRKCSTTATSDADRAAVVAKVLEGKAVDESLQDAKDRILATGFTSIDYLSYCDAHTLAKREALAEQGMLLAAAHLGSVRLIDQLKV